MSSILDALSESINNFKNTRIRNRSVRPSNSSRNKEGSIRKFNSSSSEAENFSIRESLKYLKKGNEENKDIYELGHSVNIGTSISYKKVSITELQSTENLDFDEINKNSSLDEGNKTASFSGQNFTNFKWENEIISLRQDIKEIKNQNNNLKDLTDSLEKKIHENERKNEEIGNKIKLSNLMSRIEDLQDKFSNRSKVNLKPKMVSDLFEKIAFLEEEAEKIKKENAEVEILYHSSLNEIYQKIEKLKGENKILTGVILSSPSSNSPKHEKNTSMEKNNLLIKNKTNIIEANKTEKNFSLKSSMENEIDFLIKNDAAEIKLKNTKLTAEEKNFKEVNELNGKNELNYETNSYQSISKSNKTREVLDSNISLKKSVEEEKKNKKLLDSLLYEKINYEEDLQRIQKELESIPANSKSMVNKKKKQGLEIELLEIKKNLEKIFDKINK